MIRSVLAAAAICAAFSAVPASAQERGVKVHHFDLNLSSTAGRAELDGRVRRAARTVCDAHRRGILRIDAMAQRCMTAAIASAQPAVTAAVQKAGVQMASRDAIMIKAAR